MTELRIASTGLRPTEHTLALEHGSELSYRAWLSAAPAAKALILLHRGHEHSARWQETVEALKLDDVAIFAWDARGHGRSQGERGSAENVATLTADLDQFVRHISERHGIAVADMVVLGYSLSAVVLTAWVHDYAPPIRGMILAAPAFRVRLYVPFAIPLLRLRQKVLGPGHVKSLVRAEMLTHDADQVEQYRSDKLIFRQIAVNLLLDLHDTSTRLLADAGAIATPTLLLAADSDSVVKPSAQRRLFERLSSPVKEVVVLPGFRHGIFHEKDRHLAVEKVRDFVAKLFEQTPRHHSLLAADKSGHTKNEYDRLQSPGGLMFIPTRWFMKTVGRLSSGIRLGWRAGFDSGSTLDYVYQNQPRGITPLGGLIDRFYLNSIGWRGIRQRKINLEKMLRAAIEQTHAAVRPVRILDIASGPGRYVLETIRQLPHIPATVLLRDYKHENLDAARRLVGELGLQRVTVTHGDAFDRASLVAVSPPPTIAIASGLYELFPENGQILESLRGLADAIEPGGYLIYTNQPWHPQVELIARVLVNREGRPWIMRRRTQAEMDQLVEAAGFQKIAQEIDRWGIFTVSLARRV